MNSNEQIFAALKELVELKEIKELIENNPDEDIYDAVNIMRYREEYESRKPLAWEKAKTIVEKYKHLFE